MTATPTTLPDTPLSDIEQAAWDIWQGWEACEDGDHAAVPWALISPLTALFAARLGIRWPDPTSPEE